MVTYLEYVKLQDFGCFRANECSHTVEEIEISCTTGETKTEQSISFPYYIGMLGGSLPVQSGIVSGDRGYVYTREKVPTLSLSSACSIDDTELSIFNPYWLPIWGGCDVKIGGNVYKVKSYSSGTIELCSGMLTAESAEEPIELRYVYLRNIMLTANIEEAFGNRTFGCQMLPPSMEIVIEYTHAEELEQDKSIRFRLVYFTGNVDT